MPEPTSRPAPPTAVEVVIGGRRYRLRGDDPPTLHALAARVDETLTRVAGPGGLRDDFKIAVLAALNLAGDHEEQRGLWLENAGRVAREGRRLVARLERVRGLL